MKQQLVIFLFRFLLELALKSPKVSNNRIVATFVSSVERFDLIKQLEQSILAYKAWKDFPSYDFKTSWDVHSTVPKSGEDSKVSSETTTTNREVAR